MPCGGAVATTLLRTASSHNHGKRDGEEINEASLLTLCNSTCCFI